MSWKKIKKSNFTKVEELLNFLEISPKDRQKILKQPDYALNVPLRIAQKMLKGNLEDPILRQFLPFGHEQDLVEGFVIDPVGDREALREKKLLHKYQGRALLLLSSACAMHCRYCFRREFSFEESKGFEKELQHLREDTSIEEVILSGGDPLSLDNQVLQTLISSLEEIEHLKRLRFHSRFVIGIPERIDTAFLRIIEKSRFQIYFVLHCNVAKELDADVLQALKLLQKRSALVLNQSVLLKGINDNFKALKALCDRLANNGIIFYYLHQLDRVQGACHFELEIEKGKALIEELRKTCPSYAVPRYVCEIPGEPSKTWL